MVVKGTFVVISVTSLRVNPEQVFRKLEHVVGVAGLRAFHFGNEVCAGGLAGEVFATAVTTESHTAVIGHCFPKETCGVGIMGFATDLGYPLKADSLGYLGVGVLVVEVVFALGHGIQDLTVRETSGRFQVGVMTGHLVGVGEDLVHAAVLIAQHLFHLIGRQAPGKVHSPVTELQEHVFGVGIAGIQPGISQTCVHLVDVVPGYPVFPDDADVAGFDHGPQRNTVGHTTNIAHAPVRVLEPVGFLAGLQFGQHVVHAFLASLIAGGGIMDGHGREVMTAHVTVKAVPVGKTLGFFREAGFLSIRCQQAVNIVGKQRLNIAFNGVLHRPVGDGDSLKGEGVGVELLLGLQGSESE